MHPALRFGFTPLSATPPEPAIDIRDVRFQYKDSEFALKIDRWTVDASEQIACIGPSGSGKTTLLQLLAGTLQPAEGSIRVLGSELTDHSETQRRGARLRDVGMVWQEFALLDHLSVLENTLLPLRLDPTADASSHRDKARQILSQLGMEARTSRSPANLSQGERQRVAIARALIRTPRLILADEPTGNLDPPNKKVIVDLLLDYASNHSTTVVFVTHDHSLLSRFSRTIGIDDLNSHLAAQDTAHA